MASLAIQAASRSTTTAQCMSQIVETVEFKSSLPGDILSASGVRRAPVPRSSFFQHLWQYTDARSWFRTRPMTASKSLQLIIQTILPNGVEATLDSLIL